MKNIVISFILLITTFSAFSQAKKTELYDLVKNFVADSTLYASPGDWAVGLPATYPVQWKTDRIEMSDDIKINFFRKGTVYITVNGSKPAKGNIMLRGPRSGFNSFNISLPAYKIGNVKPTIDNLFGKKLYTYKLLQSCNTNSATGFSYYQLLIPKKVISFLKLAWSCKDESCVLNLDCYDDWSKQYAELTCPGN